MRQVKIHLFTVVMMTSIAMAFGQDESAVNTLLSALNSRDSLQLNKTLDALKSSKFNVEDKRLLYRLKRKEGQTCISENRTSQAVDAFKVALTLTVDEQQIAFTKYELAQAYAVGNANKEAELLFTELKARFMDKLNQGQKENVDDWLSKLNIDSEQLSKRFGNASEMRLKSLLAKPFTDNSYGESMTLLQNLWDSLESKQENDEIVNAIHDRWLGLSCEDNQCIFELEYLGLRNKGTENIKLDDLIYLQKRYEKIPNERKASLLYNIAMYYHLHGQNDMALSGFKRVASLRRGLPFDDELRVASMRSIILIYDEMKELRLRDEWRRQIAKEKSDLAIFPTNRFIDHVDAKDRSVNYYWLLLPITAVLGLIMFWIRRMKGNGTH